MKWLRTALLTLCLTGAGLSGGAATAAEKPTDPRECLILALYHEAGLESEASLWKHAWTIAWRVKRDDFPNDICSVVFEPNEFSAFNDGIRPMKSERVRKRVSRIADRVLLKAFPDAYGGTECVDHDIYTGACVVTKAATLPAAPPPIIYYAVADCYYHGRPGYKYVKLENGDCVPYWSVDMEPVAAEPCAMIDSRPCQVVFWKEG